MSWWIVYNKTRNVIDWKKKNHSKITILSSSVQSHVVIFCGKQKNVIWKTSQGLFLSEYNERLVPNVPQKILFCFPQVSNSRL